MILFTLFSDYQVTNCGATGRYGPTEKDCVKAYSNTNISIKVMHEEPGMTGIQRWLVPKDGHYT